jgi:hypothetical protein
MSNLTHSEIQAIVLGLHESKMVNLDAPIRSLIEPIASSMRRNPGEEVSLHLLCCNEYALVTGIQAGRLDEISSIASSLKSLLAQVDVSNKG